MKNHTKDELYDEIEQLKNEKFVVQQEANYYKALAEKYEEMLENPNRNYD